MQHGEIYDNNKNIHLANKTAFERKLAANSNGGLGCSDYTAFAFEGYAGLDY